MYISLMTIPMFIRCFYRYYLYNDKEELYENYEEMLDYIENAGIKYIDITSREIDLFGVAYIKEQLSKRNISVGSVLFQNDFLLYKLTFQDMKRIIEKCVDSTKKLDCKILMLAPVVVSPIDSLKDFEIKQNLIKTFTYATQCAMRNGISAVIEDSPNLNLNLCSSVQIKEMLDAVEGLKLAYDSGNMLLVNEDPVEYYEKFKDKIGYIHLKDMRLATIDDRRPDISIDGIKMTSAFSGMGIVDFERLIKAICNSGYDGGMTVEFAYKEEMTFPDSLLEAMSYFEDIFARNSDKTLGFN